MLLLLAVFPLSALALTYAPGSITEDTTWNKENGPYIVDTLYIPEGITLTIAPGTIVKLGQPGCNCYENIRIAGRMVVGATDAAERAVFTSIKDDIGGDPSTGSGQDTNGDGAASVPTPGDWRQIYIAGSGILELYNSDVRWGGLATAPYIYFNPDNVRQINNVGGGTVIMDGADLGYGRDTNYRQWGSGTTTIRRSRIHDATIGLVFTGGTAIVEDNTFSAVGRAITQPWWMTLLHRGNTGAGGIMHTGIMEQDVTLLPDTLPYVGGWITVPEGRSLTILPGVVMKVTAFSVSGTLTLGAATATDEVIVTSYSDDSAGGDTNGGGLAGSTSPSAGDWGAIYINARGVGNFFNTKIRYGGAYTCDYWGKICTAPILQNSYGTLTLFRTIVTDGVKELLVSSGTTTILSSELAHGTYGVAVQAGTTTVHDSSIHDNYYYGVSNGGPNVVDATGNYWGDTSGPAHPSNPGGHGDRVSDRVLFSGWLAAWPPPAPPPACTDGSASSPQGCNPSVLFLPGLEASRLYRPDYSGDTDQLWEPNAQSDVTDLFLDETGDSIRRDIYTKEGVGVLDEVNIIPDFTGAIQGNVYKSFLQDLDSWKNTEHLIADYAAIPYDWRLSLDDLLNYGNRLSDGRIYYSGDLRVPEGEPYIIRTLRSLAQNSKTGKVTIIAHSNGGLLAKMLVKRLEDTDDPLLEKIDKIIMVAVPQTGTPQAIGALLHGYDQGLPKDWFPLILTPRMARAFAHNMQSGYNLLPSPAYFSGEGATTRTAPIIFDDGALTQPFITAYGRGITNPTELHDFLIGSEGRAAPEFSDIKSPSVLDPALLSVGESVHQALDDNWMPPASIAIHQIAGWGEDTLGGIRYWTGTECVYVAGRCIDYRPKLEYTPEEVIDGDGTVVVSSALAMSTSTANVSRWWVNLREYDRPFTIERKHADILEVSELRTLIENILTNLSSTSTPPLRYVYSEQPTAKASDDRLRFTLHSPLHLSAVDDAGNIVNSATSTIPGSRYKRYGEVQVLAVPLHTPVTLRLDGYASGSFTLDIAEVDGNNVTFSSTTILAIPSSTSTKATMSFHGGTLLNAAPLMVDYDGDTITDFSLAPKIGEIVTLPSPSPTYNFGGFLQPINDTAYHPEQSPSVFKGGSTIPVKFQLKNASGTSVQASTSPLWLLPERGVPMIASVDEPAVVTTSTNGDNYRWDPIAEQYVYNWSTKGLTAGYWYRIFAKLDDGTTYSVTVGLK